MTTIIRSTQGKQKWCDKRSIAFGHGKEIRASIVRSFVQYPYYLAEKVGEYTYQYFRHENKNPFPTDMSINECLNTFENTDELMSWIEYMENHGLKIQR